MGDVFYQSLPILTDFAAAARPENYRPVPDDWVVGFSDVVGSTRAISEGRYKAVNFVGAGVVAAVSNALRRRPFPFVFGGDGASFAVSAEDAAAAADALARIAAYAKTEFELELRVATAPVAEIRAAGRDIRVARFAASEAAVYAMFAGGGLTWLEERAKAGAFGIPPAAPGAAPDLSGLSCRWGVAPAKHGIVLSVIVIPRGEDPRYAALIEDIVRLAIDGWQSDRPVTVERLQAGSAPTAIALETSAIRASGVSALKARLQAALGYALGNVFHRFRLKAGAFDAALYAVEVAANADFRKFDDGLRMTLDCSPAFADKLEARLAAADAYADWGLYRQKSAQITCIVPSLADRGHVHFVDGAEGGYTLAASALKARRLLKAG
ncbi:DUF3095 family protein [Roseiarcus fermentans]|uniref:DUF3095 family protein n=1 Tax=Roseiarcus fermentans TaxID=1473586 RepID=A0A366FE61_9HYPH|nr:DUF3095 family protein [Roseiarcus fermentans]RBP12954.1 DUF3095 family protein [Roseiarcus fermentans]